MIGRLREAYVDRVAAGSGVLAFVQWFAIGLFLQVVFMIPFLPLLWAVFLLPEDIQPLAGGALFFASFLAVRVYLFALPCAEVGVIKRRGGRALWLVCGVLFGMFALGAAAALEPKAGSGVRA